MGTPAVPTIHPDNKKAAFWGATEAQAQYHHHPYVQYNPIERSSGSSSSPMENILHMFNSWSHKAESVATNVWQNRKHFKHNELFSCLSYLFALSKSIIALNVKFSG